MYIIEIVSLLSSLSTQGQLKEAIDEKELEGIHLIGRRLSDTAIVKGTIILNT